MVDIIAPQVFESIVNCAMFNKVAQQSKNNKIITSVVIAFLYLKSDSFNFPFFGQHRLE